MSGHDDLMEGWDGKEVVYDAKAEKKYHSSIWKIFIGIFTITLFLTIILTIDDLKLYFTSNTVVGEYDEYTQNATITDSEGKRICIYITKNPIHNGNEITLYYTDDITKAEALTNIGFWIFSYAFSGGGIALSCYKLHKIYKKHG